MSYTTRVTCPDLKQQVLLLEEFPEIMQRHMRPALKESVGMTEGVIEPNIPVLTGRARAAFRTAVRGAGPYPSGEVGWFGKNQPWYINVVEYGARAHEILPRKDHEVLHFGDTFVRAVQHPGFGARKFLLGGWVIAKPGVLAIMDRATVQVVNDLAVKGTPGA